MITMMARTTNWPTRAYLEAGARLPIGVHLASLVSAVAPASSQQVVDVVVVVVVVVPPGES